VEGEVIHLDDPRWGSLRGPGGATYDPRPALSRIQRGEASSEPWYELMGALQDGHEIGSAAYGAIVVLVDIARSGRDLGPYFFGLAASIEVERHRKTNPPLPGWLEQEYHTAWKHLPELALQVLRKPPNPGTFVVAMAVVALSQRRLRLGAMLLDIDNRELGDILEEYRGWKGLYREEEA
jgi:hypothetical protein